MVRSSVTVDKNFKSIFVSVKFFEKKLIPPFDNKIYERIDFESIQKSGKNFKLW